MSRTALRLRLDLLWTSHNATMRLFDAGPSPSPKRTSLVSPLSSEKNHEKQGGAAAESDTSSVASSSLSVNHDSEDDDQKALDPFIFTAFIDVEETKDETAIQSPKEPTDE